MRSIFFCALFLCYPILAQNPKPSPNLSSLTQEMTRLYSEGEISGSAIWYPAEFFRFTFEEKKKYSQAELEKIEQSFRGVNLFAVTLGQLRDEQIVYDTQESLKNRLELRDQQGQSWVPLSEEILRPELRSYVAAIRPALVEALGPSGKNVSFVFFSGFDLEGKRPLDPKSGKSFTLLVHKNSSLSKEEIFSARFEWKLPLSSLFPSKICTKCQEPCQWNWNYCPFDGTKL